MYMQVAVNDEREYEGGRLVFATDDGLVWPSRKAGSATVHDKTIAHGVTLHTRGVRYSLFFLEASTSTCSEHEPGSEGGQGCATESN